MAFRCTAEIVVERDVLDSAARIACPFDDIDWATEAFVGHPLQCLLAETDHDHHAAFLRSGSQEQPASDVFVCWRDGSPTQWISDLEVCLKRRARMDSGCMGFLHHPAQCTWEYIDPVQVALQAQADQILEAGVVGYLLRIEHPLY